MEQHFHCPCCGQDIMIFIDLDEGDVQELVHNCPLCGLPNVIRVSFNQPLSSYDIDLCQEV